MKTKINQIPLVGPKGRRELLNRINELEREVLKLEQSSSGNHTVSWEINLIQDQSYTTWESVNMTQEIYDAIINETISPINIKWYDESKREVAVARTKLSHNETTGVVDVRSGFTGAICTKVLFFEINPDGTVRVEWD